jgi:hypothetical protein
MFFCNPCKHESHKRALNASEHVVVSLFEGAESSESGSAVARLDAANVSEITYRESANASGSTPPLTQEPERVRPQPTALEHIAGADAAALADKVGSDGIELAFVPGAEDSQPLPVDQLPTDTWQFGDPLVVAYLTWNQANEPPPTDGTLTHMIKPCAHIVCVGTQENGPYLGGAKHHDQWLALLEQTMHNSPHSEAPAGKHKKHDKRHRRNSSRGPVVVASPPERMGESEQLHEDPAAAMSPTSGPSPTIPMVTSDHFRSAHRWRLIGAASMMATHIAAYARDDVYQHVAMEHTAVEKTGWAGGAVGNKGGLGIGFAVCKQVMRHEGFITTPPPKLDAMPPAPPSPSRSETQNNQGHAEGRRVSDAVGPTHDNLRVEVRHQRYDSHGDSAANAPGVVNHHPSNSNVATPTARRMPHPKSFISFLFINAHLAPHQENIRKRNEDYTNIVSNLRVGSRGPYPRIARRSLSNSSLRDCTEEFDCCFFGGDLNYRINGTKFAIEQIVSNHRTFRSCLTNNDQLTIERAKGVIFTGFHEGPLLFRPTYKFSKNKTTGLYTDAYDNGPKERLAAYCDRVLYKRHVEYRQPLQLVHYSDVPEVRTSDHKPVTALFTVGTEAPPGDSEENSIPDLDAVHANKSCCGSCVVM